MKILQLINHPQLRGAEMFASQLSKSLIEKGHRSDLLALYPGSLTQFPNGIPVEALNSSLNSRLFDWKGWKSLARLIKENQYDIVQSNSGNSLKFAVLSKLFFGWKARIVFRNASTMSYFIDSGIKKKFNKFLVDRVSMVASVSDVSYRDFIKTFSYKPDKIASIPIGIDLNPIPESAPADLAHLFQKRPVIVHVGNLSAEKNHLEMLKIFKSVAGTHPEAQMIFVGKGPMEKEIREKVAEMGLEKNVHLTGSRSDVLAIVKQADLFVLPSLIEGLPGVILEAFYCKTPVVAHNVGGISQIVQPEYSGWLVEKGDNENFVNAILDCISDKEKAEQFAENGYQMVRSRYNNPVIADQFLDAYEKALKQ